MEGGRGNIYKREKYIKIVSECGEREREMECLTRGNWIKKNWISTSP